jgi:two-component system response regulator (stage 0 sporulation protein F)
MKKKILFMDDDEAIQILYTDELTEEGYEVFTSSDGSSLMALIDETKPDLIVLDIRLGEKDGLDLLQEVRNTHYNLPVILCTAFPFHRFDLKSIAADYFVVKSSDLEELKTKIKMALDGSLHLHAGKSFGKMPKKESTLQTSG